jgi:hypothetical protein
VADHEGEDHHDDVDDHGQSSDDLHDGRLKPGEAATRLDGLGLPTGGGIASLQIERGSIAPLQLRATRLGGATKLAKVGSCTW